MEIQFIDKFYHRIHKKLTFNDSLHIDHLMTSLDSEAKKWVKTVGPTIFLRYSIESFKKRFRQSLSCVAF